jgi:CheY-like chemotaxis protein
VCETPGGTAHIFCAASTANKSPAASQSVQSHAVTTIGSQGAIATFNGDLNDGLQLQRHLAETGVPITFITATDDETVRGKALARGAAGYLKKPLNSALLMRAVQMALGLPDPP